MSIPCQRQRESTQLSKDESLSKKEQVLVHSLSEKQVLVHSLSERKLDRQRESEQLGEELC